MSSDLRPSCSWCGEFAEGHLKTMIVNEHLVKLCPVCDDMYRRGEHEKICKRVMGFTGKADFVASVYDDVNEYVRLFEEA